MHQAVYDEDSPRGQGQGPNDVGVQVWRRHFSLLWLNSMLKNFVFRFFIPAVSSVSALIRKEKPCVGEKKEKIIKLKLSLEEKHAIRVCKKEVLYPFLCSLKSSMVASSSNVVFVVKHAPPLGVSWAVGENRLQQRGPSSSAPATLQRRRKSSHLEFPVKRKIKYFFKKKYHYLIRILSRSSSRLPSFWIWNFSYFFFQVENTISTLFPTSLPYSFPRSSASCDLPSSSVRSPLSSPDRA